MHSTRQSAKVLEHRRDSSLHSVSSVATVNGLLSKDSYNLSNSRESVETTSTDQHGRIVGDLLKVISFISMKSL